MKTFSRALLAVYLLTLLWLVLFKFSFDIFGVLANYQDRSLNLIPFAGYSPGTAREMVDNFVVFVPFGLLLGVVFKEASFWQRLGWIFSFSFAAEMLQYVLAIGTTDITDLILNTSGGLAGLLIYSGVNKFVHNKKLDWLILVGGTLVLVAFLWLRMFVFKVRY